MLVVVEELDVKLEDGTTVEEELEPEPHGFFAGHLNVSPASSP